jgi:hypothetical protein
VTVLLRRLLARDNALVPAAQLRQTLNDAERELTRAAGPVGFPAFIESIREIRATLTKTYLVNNNYLPGAIAAALAPESTLSTAYSQFLQATGDRIAAFVVLIRDGVGAIVTKIPQGQPAPAQVLSALNSLDQASTVVTNLADAKAKVAAAIALANQVLPAGRQAPTPAPEALPSMRELRIHIESINLGVWILWGVLTATLGYAVLVGSNEGFGTGMDLVKCFLWGLGVQVAGQQLQQLSPAAITQSLTISMPR